MEDLSNKQDSEGKKNVSYASGDEADYVVQGATVGGDILQGIKKFRETKEEEVVYGITDSKAKGLFGKINDFFVNHSKISLKDKSYFFHMLAVMVDAGIPVVKSVKSLAYRSKNERFRRVLNTVAYNCEHGATLADAMTRFEDVFDEAEIGVVRSGEATGRLHIMLFKLSSQLDDKHDLALKLWGAAVYPIAVLCVLAIVSIGMLVYVFPTLLSLLKEGGVSDSSLPFATRVLVFLQTSIVDYWGIILIILIGVYALFRVYVGSDYGAVRWDSFKLKMPIAGGLLRRVCVLRFVSLLGLLIESGLGVIRSLQITGSAISNRLYKLKIQEVLNSVKQGGKISDSLMDSEFLFPPEIPQMLQVGEESASLGKVSEKISEQYQREINNSLKKISSVFEPVMILVVGLFVALLALAIMAPIFNLSAVVGA